MELRMGIVGAGNSAMLMAGAIPLVPECRLVAACDINESLLNERCQAWGCRGYPNLQSMLAEVGTEIDIVHVATPSGLHLPIVRELLAAGKHVLCDKPLDTTVAKMEEAIALTKNSSGRLFVVSQTRWWNTAQLVAQALRLGRLGDFVKATVFSPWQRKDSYYNSWRGKWETDGGAAMINQTIHGVDLVTWLVSLATGLDRIYMAPSGGVICRVAHSPEVLEAEDFAHMEIQLTGGSISVAAMTCADPEGPVTIEIRGTNGHVKFDATDTILEWDFARIRGQVFPQQDNKAKELMTRNSTAGVGGAKDPLAVGSVYHGRMLADLRMAIKNAAPFDLEGAKGAWAGKAIRQFYGLANDPMGLRPKDFQP